MSSESIQSVVKKTKKPRIDFIDLAKGFCIILVVLTHIDSHCGFHYPGEIGLKIFRMPLYFFLSGLFFKEYDGFVGFLKRKLNKLIIPFAFFYITCSVLLPNILNEVGVPLRNEDLLGWKSLFVIFDANQRVFSNGPIWFLLCLFILNMLFYIIKIISLKLPRNYQLIFMISASLAFGLIGHWLGYIGKPLLFYSDIAMSSMPFFCVGYIFNKYTNILIPNKSDKFMWLWIIICGIYTFTFASGVSYVNNSYCNPFIMYTCGITGTLMTILIAKALHTLPLISYYGRYSIIILCTHQLVLTTIIHILKKVPFNIQASIEVSFVLVITFLLYLLIIPFFLRFFPYVTAQKDVIKINSQNNV